MKERKTFKINAFNNNHTDEKISANFKNYPETFESDKIGKDN